MHVFYSKHSLIHPYENILLKDLLHSTNNSFQQERVYYSIDTVLNEEDATNYPIEFLNSINSSSVPAHELRLKLGVPIMLLRNLAPPKLCNGTRLIVRRLQPNIVEATILTGPGEGDDVLIPRIPLILSDMPFQFKRLQFPVRICIAITINKGEIIFQTLNMKFI